MGRQFEQEYRDSLENVTYTQEQKSAIAARAAQAAQTAQKQTRRPFGKMALIAACVAVVLVVGAGATGVLKTAAESFGDLFGGTVAQTEVIDKIGHPIGASDSNNGITVTADAIMGDKYNAVIIYTFTRDDGTVWDFEPNNEQGYLGLHCQDGWIDISGAHANEEGFGYHGMSGFIDQDPGDNAIQYIQQISSDLPLNTGVATTKFKSIEYMNWDTGEVEIVAKGKWNLRFDMNYEDSAVYFGGGETFSQEGLGFTIDEISVSPISVRVAYTVDNVMVLSGETENGRMLEKDQRENARYMENIEILLTKTDGTVVDLSGAGGSIRPNKEETISHCVKSGLLDEIIPLEELESISVGGVVFPIEP